VKIHIFIEFKNILLLKIISAYCALDGMTIFSSLSLKKYYLIIDRAESIEISTFKE
jgi:hypothetical protein